MLTPFPHTKVYKELSEQNRILSDDWNDYSADRVVFQPKNMSPEKLQELLDYAWNTFYQKESQSIQMAKLFKEVVKKEMAANTFKPRDRSLSGQSFGKELDGRNER